MKSTDIIMLWQMEGLNAIPPEPAAMQDRSEAFARQIGRRNLIEYAAGAFVVAAFGFYAFSEDNPIVRIGHLFIVAATFYVIWQLRRRTSPSIPPVAPTLAEAVDHLRGEFTRQRDALIHLWDWYMLPFVPGLALIILGPAMPNGDGADRPNPILALVALVIIGLVFYAIWWANQAAAKKLQTAIDELDAMREELQ